MDFLTPVRWCRMSCAWTPLGSPDGQPARPQADVGAMLRVQRFPGGDQFPQWFNVTAIHPVRAVPGDDGGRCKLPIG